ncbi:hypothetical protein [Pseudonocardia spinosispora]|uniref:hypothetical protein n=1 Tax=Pseudonocardia spinosispora TaxID=103441 RepID=UPI000415F506|nr:hypothetical protein [Pseudonocardia spinosispora]
MGTQASTERHRRLDLARYVASVGLCASIGTSVLYLVFGLGTLPFGFASSAMAHSLLWIWLMPCAQLYAVLALITCSRTHCAFATGLMAIGAVAFEIGVRPSNGSAPDAGSAEVVAGLVPDLLVVVALAYLAGHRDWWDADWSWGTWQEWLFVIALPVTVLRFLVMLAGTLLSGVAGLTGVGAVALMAGPVIAARFYRQSLAPDAPSDTRTTGLALLLVALLPVVAIQAYSGAHLSSPERAVVAPATASSIACGIGLLVVGCVWLLGARAGRKEPEPNR